MKTRLKNLKNIDESNECYTPEGTVKYLLEFIPDYVKTIWCPCDTEESNIVKELKQAGYDVIHTHIADGYNFLKYEPIPVMYDMVITNPPFNIKTQFLERAFLLGKPFIFYLPSDSLGGFSRYKLYSKYGANIGVLNTRINYIIKGKETKQCWFWTIFLMGNMDYKNQVFWINNSGKDNAPELF
jgi:hypothetical protein